MQDFPFPKSAHSIYYLFSAGGLQDLSQFVRFEVDSRELDSCVDALVSWNNKQTSRTLPYSREALASAIVPVPETRFLPMLWWDPETISRGYYRGNNEGYTLQIFVDQERSRIYVFQND